MKGNFINNVNKFLTTQCLTLVTEVFAHEKIWIWFSDN